MKPVDEEPWFGFVQVLTFDIRQRPKPVEFADQVIRDVVDTGACGGSVDDYLQAARGALASGRDLGESYQLDQGDRAVRAFLEAIVQRLEARQARGGPGGR
jgi:hypothetical protein